MSEQLLVGGRVLVDGDWRRRDLRLSGGRVVASGADLPRDGAGIVDLDGLMVAPGFVELQCNGGHGVDLTSDPERLWEVAAHLPRQGVTAFLPTIVTSPPDVVVRAQRALAAGPPAGWVGAVPVGLHVEGPMLAPGRHGAHDPSLLRLPDTEVVVGWSRDAHVAMVTLAPELPGALAVVDALVGAGVVVSAGHTDASFDQTRRGVDAGIRMATHVGNAMPPVRGRAPGPIAAVLSDRRVRVGCIADGVHLDPGTLALVWHTTGPDRLVLVTDAMAAAGLPDGTTVQLGSQRVAVSGGRATLADGTLAGSVATLDGCVRHLVEATGAAPAAALATVTSTPAAVLGDGDRGHLRPGARADAVVLDDDLQVVATLVGGELVHDTRGDVR